MTDTFEIHGVLENPQERTRAVLQITALLGLYQAELARILGVQCPEIGRLASGRQVLVPGTAAWQRAGLLVRTYQALYRRHDGKGVEMRHWLHVHQPGLCDTPFLAMIDRGRLADVLACLEPALAGVDELTQQSQSRYDGAHIQGACRTKPPGGNA